MKRASHIPQPPAQPPLQAAVAALAQPSARRAEIALRYLDVTRREKLTRTERSARDAASAEVLRYLSAEAEGQSAPQAQNRLPEPGPRRGTVPVVLQTPTTTETLHLGRNIWGAFEAHCAANGTDPGEVLEALLLEAADRRGIRKAATNSRRATAKKGART